MDIARKRVDREVERLFKENPPSYGELCRNPITFGHYVGGLDPTSVQKDEAGRALLAREWFAFNAPPDAQPLPTSYQEREEHKTTGLVPRMAAWYARSLEGQNYDVDGHPSFSDYVAGVLWEVEQAGGGCGHLPNYRPAEVEELKKRFPPRMLKGMSPGLLWLPPKEHAERMASWRRRSKNPAIFFNRE